MVLSQASDLSSFFYIPILTCAVILSSEDCACFNLDTPDFSLAEETNRDLDEYRQTWGLYEVWQQGLTEKAQQDWIVFRYRALANKVFRIFFSFSSEQTSQNIRFSVLSDRAKHVHFTFLFVLNFLECGNIF